MMCDTDVEGLIDMSMWIWSGATAPLSISTPSSLQILRISVLARVPISPFEYFVSILGYPAHVECYRERGMCCFSVFGGHYLNYTEVFV
jgi:hypothetical protein